MKRWLTINGKFRTKYKCFANFITKTPAHRLDNKHVVFGNVINGLKHIHTLLNIGTSNDDTPT